MHINYNIDERKVFDLISRTYRGRDCKLQSIINEFVKSEKSVVKLEFAAKEYKDTNSAYIAFAQAIKRMKMPHIKVCKRKDEIFMINTNIVPEEFKELFK